MAPKFRVDASAYLGLCLGLVTLPLPWLWGAILAAAVHEFCHYLVARTMGVHCQCVRVGIRGMKMRFPALTRKEEWLIAAAGPLGSMALLIFLRKFPQLAVSGLVQGLFNLLPVYPMDGGRILRCICRNSDS